MPTAKYNRAQDNTAESVYTQDVNQSQLGQDDNHDHNIYGTL
jgi:hypothetical protein